MHIAAASVRARPGALMQALSQAITADAEEPGGGYRESAGRGAPRATSSYCAREGVYVCVSARTHADTRSCQSARVSVS